MYCKICFHLGLLVALLTACSLGKIPSRPEGLVSGTVSFSPTPPEIWELENGLQVVYLFDDELPLVSGILYFRGGSLYEPPEHSGLASLMGSQMRNGSVIGLAPEELDRVLDNLGVSIESKVGEEYGVVSFSCPAVDFADVFPMFSQVILRPAFDPSRLELTKTLYLEAIRRRKSNPPMLAQMAFARLLFGRDSPYSARPAPQSLKRITAAGLRRAHQRFVQPQQSILALSGAVSKEKVEQAVKQYFGSWTSKNAEADSASTRSLPKVSHQVQPGIYVLERDSDQTYLVLGHQGPPRFTEDSYARRIFNRIFSADRFHSILVREIRTKLGLAYEISGGLYAGTEIGGFEVSIQTRPTRAIAALKRALQLINESRTVPPSAERVQDAVQSETTDHLFRFSSSDKILHREAVKRLLRYPDDYDEVYLERIREVSPQSIRSMAKRWIHPEKLVVVLVGSVPLKDIVSAFGESFDIYRLSFDLEPRVEERISKKGT